MQIRILLDMESKKQRKNVAENIGRGYIRTISFRNNESKRMDVRVVTMSDKKKDIFRSKVSFEAHLRARSGKETLTKADQNFVLKAFARPEQTGAAPTLLKKPKKPTNNKKSAGSPKKAGIQLFDGGWEQLLVERKGGRHAGRLDVYVVGPDGRKFRSRRELLNYVQKIGNLQITEEEVKNFFTVPSSK